jgi:hypothetical protein
MEDDKKAMLRELGFDEEIDNVDKGLCSICGSDKVKYDDFKDSLSWKEFKISGMCQRCQDETFG